MKLLCIYTENEVFSHIFTSILGQLFTDGPNSLNDYLERGRCDLTRAICQTHQPMLVGYVVGELELVEGDDLLHPLLPRRRAVRVDVHALRHLRVGLARDDPLAARNSRYVCRRCYTD